MKELDHIIRFGVRHLSPGACWHLLQLLDEVKPELILIEGLSDADHIIPFLTDTKCIPPVAILAYSQFSPVKTLVYPLAEYSPEYQALLWAAENGARSHFIDLPSGTFMGLSESEFKEGVESDYGNIYAEIARISGEDDYDSHWERCYEHLIHKNSFSETVLELGRTMRQLDKNDYSFHRAENLVREAYMRKKIGGFISEGTAPEKIVVVTGAYHTPSLNSSGYIMSDKEFSSLKKVKTSLTLMPYSFNKLSCQSGYGAGNRAPQYFQMMWELMKEGRLDQLSNTYLSQLVKLLKESGSFKSSAHIIEAVRLAESLAQLKDGWFPVLQDLRDAATTVFAEGKQDILTPLQHKLEIGNKLGSVPENSLSTSIQDDFNRLLKELKLERFRQNSEQQLKLDLRENLNVKSNQAAFLGLRRSVFLNRLRFLGIHFGVLTDIREKNWIENWRLKWSPENEINLVESVLLGETVELAVSALFVDKVKSCTDVKMAADLVKTACECGLTKEIALTQTLLQNLAAGTQDLPTLAQTCLSLSELIRYGSVRQLNTDDFRPLLKELFVEASLQLVSAAGCDNNAAVEVRNAMDCLNRVSSGTDSEVDSALFENQMRKLSRRDDLNPGLSGYATAVLLEKNLIDDKSLSDELCRRISPGIPADTGAGWFEGLAGGNHLILISKKAVWEQLSSYIDSLNDDGFKRALVFLRRTFADFAPSEIREIAAHIILILSPRVNSGDKLREIVLTDEEIRALKELDNLDFN